MPRKFEKYHRDIEGDAVFGDRRISKFVNIVMRDGKKSVAERLTYDCMEFLKEKAKDDKAANGDPMVVFDKALKNVKPLVEVKSRRVGGSTYQVPVEVRPNRQESLGMRWIVHAASERKDKSMAEKLANEFLDAANNRGGAVKKREDVHRMAEANRAFAHYRW